jgi:hypothetical protein
VHSAQGRRDDGIGQSVQQRRCRAVGRVGDAAQEFDEDEFGEPLDHQLRAGATVDDLADPAGRRGG